MTASVSNLDATTSAIGDGQSTILLKDLDNDGKVDQVAVGTQKNCAQVYGGTLDSSQTILAGEWGDPHVRNQVFEGDANDNLTQALNALKADAADGTINDQDAFQKTVAMLTNAASAGAGGRTAEIMDLQADHKLINGSMMIAVDVEAQDANVAFAENAKFTFADGSEHTITNIWNRSGQDGAIGARGGQAGDGGQSKGTFVVADADNMGHLESNHIFGAAHKSVGKYVLNVQGEFNGTAGTVGKFWEQGSVMANLGLGYTALRDRFEKEKEKEKEKDKEVKVRAGI